MVEATTEMIEMINISPEITEQSQVVEAANEWNYAAQVKEVANFISPSVNCAIICKKLKNLQKLTMKQPFNVSTGRRTRPTVAVIQMAIEDLRTNICKNPEKFLEQSYTCVTTKASCTNLPDVQLTDDDEKLIQTDILNAVVVEMSKLHPCERAVLEKAKMFIKARCKLFCYSCRDIKRKCSKNRRPLEEPLRTLVQLVEESEGQYEDINAYREKSSTKQLKENVDQLKVKNDALAEKIKQFWIYLGNIVNEQENLVVDDLVDTSWTYIKEMSLRAEEQLLEGITKEVVATTCDSSWISWLTCGCKTCVSCDTGRRPTNYTAFVLDQFNEVRNNFLNRLSEIDDQLVELDNYHRLATELLDGSDMTEAESTSLLKEIDDTLPSIDAPSVGDDAV